jgi:hypothetical protein
LAFVPQCNTVMARVLPSRPPSISSHDWDACVMLKSSRQHDPLTSGIQPGFISAPRLALLQALRAVAALLVEAVSIGLSVILLAGPDVGVEIFFGISAFIMIRTSGKAFRPAARLALGFRRLGFCHELGDFGLQLARMLIGKRAVPAALAWIFVRQARPCPSHAPAAAPERTAP